MSIVNNATITFTPLPPKVECNYLDNLEYGEVNQEGVNVGHKANYSCKDGYKLVGKSVRKCLDNGRWSGREPYCKKSKRDEF